MSRKCYILAGGGTGGHLYPGLAVAAEIVRNEPDSLVVFACSNRPIDARILTGTPYSFFAQPVMPIRKNPLQWPAVVNAWLKSLLLARKVLADLKPAAVLGLGGFAAGAICKVAAVMGIPTAMINPDAVPGKANRYLAAKVDRIFTQFAETQRYFPKKLQERIIAAGCPVRAELAGGSRDGAIKFFGLDPDKKTLLVFGGSALAET
ncbi:MAG TPA: UDP-N-acetylglucosamine--N-acetylmuramyl-(pentapeptide) pyrophosphoryl-undecaprenol N-acetylglucosamine transferase, partial [Phycisphaerae bacterium]|nr:UDP-N-acetylglucosamine--N-acetylmuramyl-(pentapeptide) pyrophosphoryl-undecaprenol N-acetylglucosamine transferase [Phycisphaerae bacterium]